MRRHHATSTYTAQLKLAAIYCAIAILLGLASECFGQISNDILVTKRDSTQVMGILNASSSTQLFLRDKPPIDFKDIAMVQFSTERKTDTDLYRKLYNAGIYVMVAGSRYGAPSSPGVATTIYDPTKAVELASTPKDPDLAGVISSIETFRKQRQIGKGLQLLGMVAGFGGFALQQKYSKDAANATKPKAAKQVPAEVFMAATVSVALGFIIDFDAGKHLRFKH